MNEDKEVQEEDTEEGKHIELNLEDETSVKEKFG